MAKKQKYPKEFIELCASVAAKRPKTVIDLIWQGEDVRQYEKLKSDAAKSGLEIPQFVKDVLARALK